jgi:WD40 repeat protein
MLLLAGLVACGTERHGVRLCDLRSGDAVHSLHAPVQHGSRGSSRGSSGGGGGASVRALDWAPAGDGHMLVAGNRRHAAVFLSSAVLLDVLPAVLRLWRRVISSSFSGTTDGCVRLWDVRKGGSAQRSYLLSFDAQQEDHLGEGGGEQWASSSSSRKRGRDGGAPPRSEDPAAAAAADGEDKSCIDFTSRRRTEAMYSAAAAVGVAGGRVGAGGVHARVRRREEARAAGQALDWSREGAAVAHRAEVVALKYSPSGAHLVSCGNDGQVGKGGWVGGCGVSVCLSPCAVCVRLCSDIVVVFVACCCLLVLVGAVAVVELARQVILWGTASGKKYPINYSPDCCKTRLRYDIGKYCAFTTLQSQIT